jgi:hypothetical protein
VNSRFSVQTHLPQSNFCFDSAVTIGTLLGEQCIFRAVSRPTLVGVSLELISCSERIFAMKDIL